MSHQLSKKTDSYHHGNLRAALLEAALHVIVEKGVANFTLREVARQAGVSHNAPYFHFASKAELIEALVAEQFALLADALRAASTLDGKSALERLQETAIAYVTFALERPAAFRLMFRPELRASGEQKPGETPQSAIASYQALIDIISECQKEKSVGIIEPSAAAFAAWSLVHGVATILIDGAMADQPPMRDTPPEMLTRWVASLLVTGLRQGTLG